MSRNVMSTNAGIAAEIAKGWKPNQYLTNMSQAYFAQPGDWVALHIRQGRSCEGQRSPQTGIRKS